MTLVRTVRPLPYRPTPEALRKLMRQYGLTRRTAARLMRVAPSTLDRYVAGRRRIPRGAFELLQFWTAVIFHPDEPVELMGPL